ncbi:MAG: aminoglycoside O-phosphotransferase APH(9)-Ia [Anaerolineae bacterium]
MIDKPAIPDADVIQLLHEHYALSTAALTFLPLGADPNAAVYRVDAVDNNRYFLKLKRGHLNPVTVEIPYFLREQGIQPVVGPRMTVTGQLFTSFQDYNAILYPFIEGQDGYTTPLSPANWTRLGAALKAIHTAELPSDLQEKLRHEDFSPHGRSITRAYLAQIHNAPPGDALAEVIYQHREIMMYLVRMAEHLAARLQAALPSFVLCHADIHAWNVMIDTRGTLFIVDWDDVLLAPKERDLMFVGAGIGGIWDKPEEAKWFYAGYGPAQINRDALAYYRHERIVQDIAVTIEEWQADTHSEGSRALMLAQLRSQFAPNSLIEIARRT